MIKYVREAFVEWRLEGKLEVHRTLSQLHFVHKHKFHTDWRGVEHVSQWWETGNWSPDIPCLYPCCFLKHWNSTSCVLGPHWSVYLNAAIPP